MNETARQALINALANVEDELYRYRHFASRDDLVGGGPQTVADVIRALEKQKRELEEALR